jgi:rhodanese-related sulfurtransferase
MTLEVLPTHKKFSAQDNQYQLLRSRLSSIITKLEEIKIKLKSPGTVVPTMSASSSSIQSTNQTFTSAVSNRFPSMVARRGPSTPVKSSIPQLSGISAVEIQTLLANSNPKILFIDIRPLEEYIQGHIGWRSSQHIPTAGLVNIEPDWLKDGVSAIDIEHYLTSFGSSSNSAKLLFDARFAGGEEIDSNI